MVGWLTTHVASLRDDLVYRWLSRAKYITCVSSDLRSWRRTPTTLRAAPCRRDRHLTGCAALCLFRRLDKLALVYVICFMLVIVMARATTAAEWIACARMVPVPQAPHARARVRESVTDANRHLWFGVARRLRYTQIFCSATTVSRWRIYQHPLQSLGVIEHGPPPPPTSHAEA